ncbi:MAG: twin-arginine translocase TatA/TatE family subunit [Leptonema sp. (in: bacteria)]
MKTFLIIGGIGTTELFIILVIVLLLFGGRKIPQLAKDIGLGIKEFKKGLSSNEDIQKLTYEDSEPMETPQKKENQKASKKKK